MQDRADIEECTFRPHVVATARTRPLRQLEGLGIASQMDVAVGEGGKRLPLHERLHHEAREREAARALTQFHLEKEALRECTFHVSNLAIGVVVL